MNFRLFRTEMVSVALVLALMACDQNKQDNGQAAAPPPEVGVFTVTPERLTITTELPGRTQPFRIAEVRPQVSGVVLKRMFAEGSEVKEGQQLYQIDPATYQAAYDSARASQARAEATRKVAVSLVERYRPLVAANAVSKQDYDNAVASADQAAADVALYKAQVETARINLVYTRVLAPISGRIGRSAVTEGALVTSGQSSIMASVQQLDPIYVDVTQSSTEMLRLQRELAAGRLKSAGDGATATKLLLEDGSEYPLPGKLLFSEVTVDSSTGSVTLRAQFPNPNRLLLPGMFVRAQIDEGVAEAALLVPQQGVTRNQRGEATALVVGEGDKVEQRVLNVDRTLGDRWLVKSGLVAGDRVIVEGLQKVKPGAPVRVAAAGQQPGGQTPAAK